MLMSDIFSEKYEDGMGIDRQGKKRKWRGRKRRMKQCMKMPVPQPSPVRYGEERGYHYQPQMSRVQDCLCFVNRKSRFDSSLTTYTSWLH